MVGMSGREIHKIVIEAYDNIAEAYVDAYTENDEIDYRYLEKFINVVNGKCLLDMGCGTGGNAFYLSKKGFDVTGIDDSSGMLKVAKKYFPDIKFYKEDILETSFQDNSFDGIVLAYVINHFDNEGLNLLKHEIDRILKLGGAVFVSAHVGDTEEIVPDPLDENVKIYYNFISIERLDALFEGYKREYYETRETFGEEEFLCDKLFAVYRKKINNLCSRGIYGKI